MISILTDDERVKTLLDDGQGEMWLEAISDMVCDAIDKMSELPDSRLEEKQQIMENITSMMLLRRTLKGLGKKCQVMEVDNIVDAAIVGDKEQEDKKDE